MLDDERAMLQNSAQSGVGLNRLFASVFHALYATLACKLLAYSPCCVYNISPRVYIPEGNTVEIVVTAMAMKYEPVQEEDDEDTSQEKRSDENGTLTAPTIAATTPTSPAPTTPTTPAALAAALVTTPTAPAASTSSATTPTAAAARNSDHKDLQGPSLLPPLRLRPRARNFETWERSCVATQASQTLSDEKGSPDDRASQMDTKSFHPFDDPTSGMGVEITTLPTIPFMPVERYLGRVSLHVIKENSIKEKGLGIFTNRFLAEANALVRAQVVSRGGNALLGYFLHEYRIVLGKNQAYAVVNISGDAARISAPTFIRGSMLGHADSFSQNRIPKNDPGESST